MHKQIIKVYTATVGLTKQWDSQNIGTHKTLGGVGGYHCPNWTNLIVSATCQFILYNFYILQTNLHLRLYVLHYLAISYTDFY